MSLAVSKVFRNMIVHKQLKLYLQHLIKQQARCKISIKERPIYKMTVKKVGTDFKRLLKRSDMACPLVSRPPRLKISVNIFIIFRTCTKGEFPIEDPKNQKKVESHFNYNIKQGLKGLKGLVFG